MYCCYVMIFIAEVRAANERLHPQGRVRVVISREDAEDRVNRRYVVDMA